METAERSVFFVVGEEEVESIDRVFTHQKVKKQITLAPLLLSSFLSRLNVVNKIPQGLQSRPEMPQKRSKERRKVNLLAAADATTTEMPRRCCTAAGPTAAAGAARSDARLPAAAAVTATPEVAEREARARRAIFFASNSGGEEGKKMKRVERE